MMPFEIHNQQDLIQCIQDFGFLPLLRSTVAGFSAEEMADEECRYVVFPDGGWDWPLWKWKGPTVTESPCVYGKFYAGKAGFVSRKWWPHLYNYRRALSPTPEEGTIDDAILQTLREHGSLITRQLRQLCGFTGPKERSRFDARITRLQMGCHIVTEDFVYPRDRHNREYGWGWSLLTTPEQLLGREACQTDCSPEDSLALMQAHLRQILPKANEQQLLRLLHA